MQHQNRLTNGFWLILHRASSIDSSDFSGLHDLAGHRAEAPEQFIMALHHSIVLASFAHFGSAGCLLCIDFHI
ncbi:MAG: hypothetical protein IJ724_07175 [Muribaculaceae bacterium]|nr:hypothetical protein [Muribaculaceae bacterium]